MRSWLFVPGNRPDRIGKALASSADAVIVDWEDAVVPEDKGGARDSTAGALEHDLPRRPWIRINAEPEWQAADLAILRTLDIAGVVLPKAECVATCERLVATGWPIMALVETPLGIERAGAIAGSGIRWLAFGSLDYLAALQGEYSADGEALAYPRARLVNAARAGRLNGVVDGAFVDLGDTAGLTAETERARRLGFDGKLLLHPCQIEPVHAALAPSAEDLAWAERVLQTWANSPEQGVLMVDGRMIDAPLIAAARVTLRRAGRDPQATAGTA